jgi:hypothetical protein
MIEGDFAPDSPEERTGETSLCFQGKREAPDAAAQGSYTTV